MTRDPEAERFLAAGIRAYRDALTDYVTLARTNPDTDPPLVLLEEMRTHFALSAVVVAHEHARACQDLLEQIVGDHRVTEAERVALGRVTKLLGVTPPESV